MRAKTVTEQDILAAIAPVAQALGLEIVRVRLFGRQRRKVLQIMAERADHTMTVEDCAALSRAISAIIDVQDPVGGAYDLEVSSPGIERPLTRLEDFAHWAGHEARLELDRLVEGRRRFRGVLAGVEDGNVAIDLEGEGETALIPYAWIGDARLVMSDALMKPQAAPAAKP